MAYNHNIIPIYTGSVIFSQPLRSTLFDVAHDWVGAGDSTGAVQTISLEPTDVPLEILPAVSGKDVFWKIKAFRLRDRLVAENLEIDLPKGTVVIFEGSNGSGKSTLLRSMARLPQP